MSEPTFPEGQKAWLENFERFRENTAGAFLGIKLESISDDQIVLTMPISDRTRQPYGLLHGGITMALVESAASIHASWGIDLSKVVPVGIEINGSHVRSATEGTVRAVGKVVRRSRSMIVHQVDVYLVETGNLLSTARMTNYYKPVSKEK
jgi:uncharacterized protein (TIGR00369 family)